MKKLLTIFLALMMLACTPLMLASCGPEKQEVPQNTKWELSDIQNIELDGEAIDSVQVSLTQEVLKRLYGEYTWTKDSKGYITETTFCKDRIEFKDGKVYYHEAVGSGEGEKYNSATVYAGVDWTVEECGTYEGKEITVTFSECIDIYFAEDQLVMKAQFKSGSSDSITTADLIFTKVGAML